MSDGILQLGRGGIPSGRAEMAPWRIPKVPGVDQGS